MKIYSKSGIELLDIQVDDTSVRYRSIMKDDSLTLKFSHTEIVSVPVGSYVNFEGQRYTLWLPENFKKHNTRNFEYTIVFGGWREALKLFKFKDLSSVPYRLKFSLTAKPVGFLQLLVDNMNVHDSGWTVGSYIDTSERTISFNHEYCADVLSRIAQEFNTEYDFEGKKIHLHKVEKFKSTPLALSYGRGNGFKSGVGRANDGDKQPIGRLYVQGGERNIDYSKYGSTTLLLPKSETLVLDGKTYRTDAEGMCVTRDGNDLIAEDSYDAKSIYPRREGTVSAVEEIDAEQHFYDIIDASIPEELDYADYRIEGDKATISFQSGALAGREFDIEQTDKALTGYIHEERRFKIVPQELDGVIMPGGAFVPAVGDKYAIFNISMPASYVSDASMEMFEECAKYFAENEKQKFTFTGELDGIWARKEWLEIGGKIVPGGHVLFSDEQFLPDGEVIRITSIKDYVNFPYKPEITLSNTIVPGGLGSDLGDLEAEEVVTEELHKKAIRYSKRRWRDTVETMSLLEKALLNFDKGINPIFVQTMQLLVGDESLQFRFVNNKTNPSQVEHNVFFNAETKVLTSPGGIIQHMTLGVDKVSSSHKPSEYKFWTMAGYNSPPLTPESSYYLYARCSKSNSTGSFLLSETSIAMDAEAGFHHLLVGVLNSEFENERSFVTLYGFTEILPGRITTDKIISADGKTYFDLAGGEIGGKIKFLNENNELEDIEKVKLFIQYSVNGSSWHDVYNVNDKYMRQKNGASGTWSGAMPIRGADGYTPVKGTDYFDGEDGTNGVDGKSKYMYIRYSNTSDGTGFDTNPENKKYIGIAVTESATPPTLKGGYNWTLVKGPDGVKGEDGEDGESRYLHIKYSNNGTTFTANNGETVGSWIGMYVDAVEADSNTFGAYTWNKIVGADGKDGKDGKDGLVDPETVAKIDRAAAITDKLGTTVDGGLLSTIIIYLRDLASAVETAGLSGIQGLLKDNPAFWAGGSHADALAVTSFLRKIANNVTPNVGEYASLAKIALLHSGGGKLGDFIVEESGRIIMVDPVTGKERLVFSVESLPDIKDLVDEVSSTGSITIGSGSTSTSQTLSGVANVTQTNGTGIMGAGNITISASGKKQLNGVSSFVSAELVLYRGSTRIRDVWNTSLFFTGDSYQHESETRSYEATNINLSGKDNYHFKLEVVRHGDISSAYATSTSFPFSWNASLQGVNHQQYSPDGMMFFYSNHHFHFSETKGLTVGGKMNIPGVLASGTISTGGGLSNEWGAKVNYGQTITGGYRIFLKDMTHNKYSVQVTPHTNVTFRVSTKTSTYFDILGTGAADFVVFGSNY